MDDQIKYMTDSMGRQVPETLVSALDKLRDETVRAVVEQALAMRDALARFKAAIQGDIFAFVDLSFQQYGKKYGGAKGNITLTSFDGRYKLIVAVDENIAFNERLQVAKTIIDRCIHRWSEGSRVEIRALVTDAFYVDKTGNMNVARILGLRRLQIQDEEWKSAMTAIAESIVSTGSKQYLRIYQRNAHGAYEQVALDIAAL